MKWNVLNKTIFLSIQSFTVRWRPNYLTTLTWGKHTNWNGNKFLITGLLYLFPCERALYVCIAETETQVWKLRPGNAKNGQGQVQLCWDKGLTLVGTHSPVNELYTFSSNLVYTYSLHKRMSKQRLNEREHIFFIYNCVQYDDFIKSWFKIVRWFYSLRIN